MKVLNLMVFSSLMALSMGAQAQEGCSGHEHMEVTGGESVDKALNPIRIDESINFDTNVNYSSRYKENCYQGEICGPFTKAHKDKIARAEELIRRVIKSSIFRDKIVNYKWSGYKLVPKLNANGKQIVINGKKQWKKVRISGTRFIDNKGYSDAEIYQKILEAAETRPSITKPNEVMDVELILYRRAKNPANEILGYTYPNVKWAKVNQYYLERNDLEYVAQNLFHEWLHKVGFGHDSKKTPTRRFSVPYGAGTALVQSYYAMKRQGMLRGF